MMNEGQVGKEEKLRGGDDECGGLARAVIGLSYMSC